MVKLNSDIFDSIRGSFKRADLTFQTRKIGIVLEDKPIPSYRRTEAQDRIRTAYRQCCDKWKQLSEEEKEAWREEGRRRGITAFNAFLSNCIKQKPTAPTTAFYYKVIIDNTQNSNDLADYQVLLVVNADQTFFSTFNNDHKYLEAYDSDQKTAIAFFIEEWDTNNYNAKIWFKIPSIPANSSKEIFLAVNLNRTESLSNPDAVFEFFDDFLGTSLDTTKWNVIDATGFSISNGLLKGTDTTGVIHSIKSFTPQRYGYTLEVLLKPVNNGDWGFTAGGFYKSATDGLTYLKRPTQDYIINNNDWVDLGSEKMSLNVFNKLIVTAKTDGTVDVKIIRTDTRETTYQATLINTVSDEVIRLGRRYDGGLAGKAYEAYWDWVRVRKYTEPEPTLSYIKL